MDGEIRAMRPGAVNVMRAKVRPVMCAMIASATRALVLPAALACLSMAALAQAPPATTHPGGALLAPVAAGVGGGIPSPAAGVAQAPAASASPGAVAGAPSGPAGGAAPSTNAPAGPPRGGQAVREFLGLGPQPDAAAVKRGAPIYAANCAFCHGPLARGAEGPSLIYSELVLKDGHGAVIAEFLKGGRPEKGMPAFATLPDEQRKDIAEFLHQQVEDVANRGTYEIKNIVLGNPGKGAKYVAAHCLGCHRVSGDLKGLGGKWRPADLQRNWIMPPRTGARAITAKVRDSQHSWEGRVQQIDDFRIALEDKSGQLVVVERNPDVTVELHDPLAPHVAMIGNVADPDMINVTAYLETLE